MYIRLLLCLLCAGVLHGQHAQSRKATVQLPWPGLPAQVAEANAMPVARVESFVNSLFANVPGPAAKIKEFRFVPLEAGTMYLLATADFSGRGFDWNILLIRPDGNVFRCFEVSSAGPHFLPREVVDIDGDGVYEILTKELVGGYEGAETLPVYWISVMKPQGESLIDVSEKYPELYRRDILPEVNFMIRLLQPPANENPVLIAPLAEFQFVQFKIGRRVLGDSKAGLHEAIEWSRSKRQEIQILAVETLKDIADPGAVSSLTTLAGSTNSAVARRAKAALSARKH